MGRNPLSDVLFEDSQTSQHQVSSLEKLLFSTLIFVKQSQQETK